MSKKILCATVLCALSLGAQRPPRDEQQRPGAAERQQQPSEAKPEQRPPAQPPQLKEETSITHHAVRIGGQEIKYTATAGTMVLKREDGTSRASIFYIAYTKDDVKEPAARPITYSFNGGPGSSSVWLHLGALGPKRVQMQDDGHPLPPPYKLVDNEYSILDRTDLVFIDPVTTGFSRPAQEREAAQFHGFREDLASVGEFIRLYTTRNMRWASPKYLAGESYGTTRAAGLSGYLQNDLGMNLNGIMLISSVLNFGTIGFDVGNDLPYITFLPTYTATAWYHKKLPKELLADFDKTVAEAKQFALGEYAQALIKGDRLSAPERASVVKKLARYTGLSPRYIESTDLRIQIGRFCKELLREERRTVGRYDSRFEGIDRDAAGERTDYDPSYAVAQGPYTAMFNQYVREQLKFASDLPYEILTGRVRPWNWAPYENRYVNVAETLRGAMTQNPSLRVFIAKGYYDLATPFFGADYVVDHLGLDPSLRSHVSGEYYGAGHMLYLHKPSLEKLKRDLAQFIQ